mmetsp:Transcript_8597/g.24720  ORF Transcript_8597/g.24720 Transcript_8597/m.24720 type:complete len:224 (+) Transcript_8597:1476-2147(+)
MQRLWRRRCEHHCGCIRAAAVQFGLSSFVHIRSRHAAAAPSVLVRSGFGIQRHRQRRMLCHRAACHSRQSRHTDALPVRQLYQNQRRGRNSRRHPAWRRRTVMLAPVRQPSRHDRLADTGGRHNAVRKPPTANCAAAAASPACHGHTDAATVGGAVLEHDRDQPASRTIASESVIAPSFATALCGQRWQEGWWHSHVAWFHGVAVHDPHKCRNEGAVIVQQQH